MVAWKNGDEVYGRFLREQTYFEPRHVGVVAGIGKIGFTVKLDKPRWDGARFEKLPFHTEHYWQTLEVAEAYCTQHPAVESTAGKMTIRGPARVCNAACEVAN